MDSDEEDSAEEDDEGGGGPGGADAGIFDDEDPGFEGNSGASLYCMSLTLGVNFDPQPRYLRFPYVRSLGLG
jgi:hypothetical protein